MIVIDPSFQACWKPGLSDKDYHADRRSLSSSGARTIANESLLTFKSKYILGEGEERSDSLLFGRAMHSSLLENQNFMKSFAVIPPEVKAAGHPNSTAYKCAKANWVATLEFGVEVLDQDDYDRIQGMLGRFIEHPDAFDLLNNGIVEVAGYGADPDTGILCRIKPDILSEKLGAIVDYKTVQDCSHQAFQKTLWNYRYDMQLAFYKNIAELITGKSFPLCVFICQEKKPPYEVAVYCASSSLISAAERDLKQVMSRLKESLLTQRWPGKQESIMEISRPAWAI